MTQVLPPALWMRQVGALTVDGGEWQAVQAPTAAARLAVLAHSFVSASSVTGARCRCDACREDELCDLALTLARCAPPSLATATLPGDLAAAREAFVQALAEATEAVYYCRRVEHASGRCLFSSTGPADRLCGRVLAAAHRLRAP